MKEIIKSLRAEGLKVTMYDIDEEHEKANFVLAVLIMEPLDIWYVALVMKGMNVTPKVEGWTLFFPQLPIDAETYEYIRA